MSFNDPIAELLTRIRNALNAKHRYVDVNTSKMRKRIATILKDEGFIENFIENTQKGKIRIFLKYNKQRNSIIRGIKRVSRPGLRRYVGYNEIPKVFGGIGITILSTSKGVMNGEAARQSKAGGELLCYVW